MVCNETVKKSIDRLRDEINIRSKQSQRLHSSELLMLSEKLDELINTWTKAHLEDEQKIFVR